MGLFQCHIMSRYKTENDYWVINFSKLRQSKEEEYFFSVTMNSVRELGLKFKFLRILYRFFFSRQCFTKGKCLKIPARLLQQKQIPFPKYLHCEQHQDTPFSPLMCFCQHLVFWSSLSIQSLHWGSHKTSGWLCHSRESVSQLECLMYLCLSSTVSSGILSTL